MRKVVFDIETMNAFSEVASNSAVDLDISVVVIYDYETDLYTSFEQHELHKLWPILEKTDMLIGFNSNHFDIPLLNKYYSGDLNGIKSLDILAEIKEQFGRRMKLGQIAEGTLGIPKSGHGLDAIKWWRNGEKDKVISYCKDDVKITKDVYEYALNNGMLKFKEGGKINEIKLDTSKWEVPQEPTIMTHTLPF